MIAIILLCLLTLTGGYVLKLQFEVILKELTEIDEDEKLEIN